MTHGFDDLIMNGEKSSFGRMMFDIGRLESVIVTVMITEQVYISI